MSAVHDTAACRHGAYNAVLSTSEKQEGHDMCKTRCRSLLIRVTRTALSSRRIAT